MNVYIDYIKLN